MSNTQTFTVEITKNIEHRNIEHRITGYEYIGIVSFDYASTSELLPTSLARIWPDIHG